MIVLWIFLTVFGVLMLFVSFIGMNNSDMQTASGCGAIAMMLALGSFMLLLGLGGLNVL